MHDHKKLMISLAAGIPAEHNALRDLLKKPELASGYLDEAGLTKSDLLSTMVGDKHLFEEKSAWDHFRAFARRIMAGGETFTEDDFTRPLKGDKSLIDLAKEAGALDKLFEPEIFVGDIELFKKLWFVKVPPAEREKMNVRDLRRVIAAQSGERIREDVLADAGITVDDMREAIRKGKLDDVRTKLAAAGEILRAEDMVLLDKNGKIVYEDILPWENIGTVIAELQRNGQLPEPAFFQEAHGVSKSILANAGERSKLSFLLVPVLWQAHASELLEVYNGLSSGLKTQVAIEKVVAEIDELNHGAAFTLDDRMTAGRLVAPIGQATGAHAIRPIGLPGVWSNFKAVAETCARNGDPITMAHLREKSGMLGMTGFRLGVRLGHIQDILAVLPANDTPKSADYADSGATGEKTLSLVSGTESLKAVFDAVRWISKPAQFLEALGNLSDSAKSDIKVDEQHQRLHREGFRQLRV